MARTSSLILALAILHGAAACTETTSVRERDGTESTVRAVREAASGRVTLRILADGEGSRRYLLGASPDTLRFPELVARFERLSGGVPSDSTILIYTYPGARGFDVVRAMQAAEAVGFRQVHGVADFSDDESLISRMRWKDWEQRLDPDSSRRARRADSVLSATSVAR